MLRYLSIGDFYKDSIRSGVVVSIDSKYQQIQIKKKDGSYEIVNTKNMNMENNNHQLHKKLLDDLHETYLRKNHDYGDSFAEQYKEYGALSAVIRFDDKIRRIKQLMKNKAKVNDESMMDSALDLSNYAIMFAMELIKEQEKLK